MRSREQLGRALLASVRDPAPPDLAGTLAGFLPDDLPQLALHASRHRVVPFLARALHRSGLDAGPQAARELERTQAHWAAVHMGALADLAAFRGALGERAVPFLVVKGPVLAERLYPDPALRTYEDLDLLVRPADFAATIDALEASGFALLDRNWTLIRTERRAQLHLRLTLGTLADVHWHLLNRESVRSAFDVSTEDLMARARTVDVAGIPVLTLDPIDTLLHLCLHATLSGGDRLIWSKDIERAIVVEPPDWDEVVRRAQRWRAAPSVAIALRRSARLLGAPVPAEVQAALFGSDLRRRLTDAVDRRAPVERSAGEVSVSVLWSQVCRDRWGATLAAAAERAGRRSRNAIRPGSTVAPIFTPTGGEPSEQAYLRTVGESETGGSAEAGDPDD